MIVRNDDILLKDGTSDKDLKIYEIYIQRIKYEGDLFWSRFKIFFGFNSGVLIILGYIIQPHLTPNCFDFTKCILITIFLLSLVGFSFSVIWLKSIQDGKHWILFFNSLLSNIEMEIFKNKKYAMYFQITEDYNKQKIKKDVMDLGIYVSDGFIIIWIFFISISGCAIVL